MTKFLLLIIVVAVVLWLMSSRRSTVRGKRRAAPPAPEAMVACAHCGVHLPRSDAVEGRDGQLFCGSAHRLAHEREAGRS